MMVVLRSRRPVVVFMVGDIAVGMRDQTNWNKGSVQQFPAKRIKTFGGAALGLMARIHIFMAR